MNDLVSIILPTYNHAHFLKKALQSIFDQNYTNWEVLVIDNNSKDDTDEIVNSFADKRIKLLKINNRGIIAASRNLGINNARGKWIAFIDSDDWWYSQKLNESLRALNQGASFICHAEHWVKNNKIIKTVKYGPIHKASYKQLLFGKNCISTSAVTVSREYLLKVGGFTEKYEAIGVEDYHLWLKLAKAGCNMEFLSQVLGCYRVHETSQSRNLLNQMKSEIWVVEDHFKSYPIMGLQNKILRLKRIGRIYLATFVRYILKIIS